MLQAYSIKAKRLYSFQAYSVCAIISASNMLQQAPAEIEDTLFLAQVNA